ncbi:DNA LIGASE 6 isoform X2 [Wolffia australiana]
MEEPPPPPSTLAFSSSSLFLDAYKSFSSISSPSSSCDPPSIDILRSSSALPPVPRSFPHHKIIPGTRFIVDGFRFHGDFSVSYFLTHFHSDHYEGLGRNWCRGMVFCSDLTARLLVDALDVSSLFVVPLSVDRTVQIDGCEVTLVEANHCPGAVQFLFSVFDDEIGGCRKYVHTGDFRFNEAMRSDRFLRCFVGAEAVFLDTTYCNPRFCFLSQDESVEYIANQVEKIKSREDSVLILIPTYVLGKERILLEVSRRLNCQIHVDSRRMKILRSSGLADSRVFTEDPKGSFIHVIGWNLLGETWPYFRPNFAKMKEITTEKGFSRAVGFVPSGWMHQKRKREFPVIAEENLEIHLVPYSEHSSYEELREYVRFLRPKRVIPTVGVHSSKGDRKQGLLVEKHFADLLDETANKRDLLKGFFQAMKDTPESEEECLQITSYSRNQNTSSDEEVEKNIQDLREFLPSWVSQEQILRLLNDSSGDIVAAASLFVESETEFFEEVNPLLQPCIGALTGFPESQPLDPKSKSPVKVIDHKKDDKNVVASPQKRRRELESRTKKQRRICSALQMSGHKQSTITNFFGKITSCSSSNEEVSSQGIRLCSHNEREASEVDTQGKLNEFLCIINGGLTPTAATSLLDKTRWDINTALDQYYTGKNETPALDIKESFVQRDKTTCIPEKEAKPLEENAKFPSLAIKEVFIKESDKDFVSLPLDEYSPVEHACWEAGQPAPYLHLARTFDLVEKEKGKTKIISMLCNMFRSLLALSPEDVLPAVYLCTNKIAPPHKNMELNIGGGLVTTALEQTCGVKRSKIRDLYNELGDLGDVAQSCRQAQTLLSHPRCLSVQNVFSVFNKISLETGNGSVTRKKLLIQYLMRSCREMEMKFLVRTLVRNLRIGAMMRTILPALAQAVLLNEGSLINKGLTESHKIQLQEISATVIEAYNILPNLDLLVPALMSKGSHFSSSTLEMSPGSPILPMLAKIANGAPQVLNLFTNKAFACEYKYDGQRAQIHKLTDGSVRVFSRNMSETTSKFPDLVNLIKESCRPSANTFILDTEVVAIERGGSNRLMSFQELSSRERGGRGSTVSLETIKVDICIFLFDIMFCDGKQLLSLSLRQRRKYLEALFPEQKPGYLELAKEITIESDEAYADDGATLDKLNSFLEEACKSSCEGIIAKTLDITAGYAPSKRSDAWLKVKRDYVAELGDSLDLVPIGAWFGNGRKAGWYSPFLLACYKPSTEEFQSVCRVMSGFSDVFYTEMKDFFSGDKILPKKPPYYLTDESPDVWFSPELVWQIRGADMTISPVHHAAIGLVHPSRGISMRFPRFICSMADRRPEDCSTDTDIAEIFSSQTRKMNVRPEE